MAKASRWLRLFLEFIHEMRISSKEVVSDDPRGSKLDLWDSQRRFIEELSEGLDEGVRIFNCLKSRQLGITTVSLAIDTFWLAMHNNLTGALVTDTEKNRDVNRSTIERYVQSFPEGYFGNKFEINKSNRQFMTFSNGSRIDFLVAGTKKKTTAWGEGVGYAYIHETETASYGDADGLKSFEESFAQTNPNRLMIRESTAKGFQFWRDIWLEGKNNPLTERSFFIGFWASKVNTIWRSDPRFAEYGTHAASGEERELVAAVARLYGHRITDEQLAWIRWKEATAGSTEQDMLSQNQPWTENQAFIMTGYSFFQTRALTIDMKRIWDADPPVLYSAYEYQFGPTFFDMKMEILDGTEESRPRIELKVWEQPKEGGKYVIGFDPAFGRNDHKDRHAIEVYRCFSDRIVQVCEYATSNVEVKHAAWVCAHLAGAYSDCIVNVEIGGPGRLVMMEWDHIRGMLNAEMNEKLVKSRDWENALGNARWYLYSRPDAMGKGFAANFETTWRTKQEIMHQMRGAYVTHELDIKSVALLEEMRIVVQDGQEIGAPESKAENSKDDRVFATALAVRAWINWRRPEMLSNGETYESVMKTESGEISTRTNRVNTAVFAFLRNANERADLPAPPTWREERGLE